MEECVIQWPVSAPQAPHFRAGSFTSMLKIVFRLVAIRYIIQIGGLV